VKNTLGDLNNYLFAELERLDKDDISDEELDKEISRARALTSIASKVISNGSLVLRAKMAYEETLRGSSEHLPKMLNGECG